MAEGLQDLVIGIFDCAASLPSVNDYRAQIKESLTAIGTAKPEIFFFAAHAILIKRNDLSSHQRAFILSVINEVLGHVQVIDYMDEQRALLVISLVVREITIAKENEEVWPQAACDVLVTLAKNVSLVVHVIEAILQKFPPGSTSLPHRYIVLSLAYIAENNAVGFIPFLTDILSRAIPLLPLIKADLHRYAWCYALRSFCESLREYMSTSATTYSSSDVKEEKIIRNYAEFSICQYSDQLEMAYEPVFSWLSCRDPKVKAEAAYCVGELCFLMSQQRLNDEIRRLVPVLIQVHRKAVVDQHLVTQGICRLLEAACSDDSCPLESYLEDILNSLFYLVCIIIDEANVSNLTIRNQNEAFRCFHVAAARFADKIVYYLLHKMQSNQDSCKLGSINLLRYLLNSAGPYMEDKRVVVMLGLKPILQAGFSDAVSIRVKKGLCQLCIALADHGYIDSQNGVPVIEFLMNNVINVEDNTRRSSTDLAVGLPLGAHCLQALQTIINTCSCSKELLWPSVLGYICLEVYNPVISGILKCVRLLTERMLNKHTELDFETGFDEPSLPSSNEVLSRLLVCLTNATLNGTLNKRAFEALRLIHIFRSWFRPIDAVICDHHSNLYCFIETSQNVVSLSEPRVCSVEEWHTKVLEFVDSCSIKVEGDEWRIKLVIVMMRQLPMFSSYQDEKAFLMRCVGKVLARISNTAFIEENVLLLIRITNHVQLIERVGCAQAVGCCAVFNGDLVFSELEKAMKWDVKKRIKVLGFIQDMMPYRNCSDSEMANLQATIILTYGYIVYNRPPESEFDNWKVMMENKILPALRRCLENLQLETVVREAALQTIFLILVSIHSLRIDASCFNIREFLAYVENFIKLESTEMLSSCVSLLSGKVIAALLNLQWEKMSSTSGNSISLFDDGTSVQHYIFWSPIQALICSVFSLRRERSGLKTEGVVYESLDYISQISNLKGLSSSDSNIDGTLTAYSSAVQESSRIVINCGDTHGSNVSMNISSLSLRRKNVYGEMSTCLGSADERSTIMQATIHQLHEIFKTLVLKRPVMNTITSLLKLFQQYYLSHCDHERIRSVNSTLLILNVYFDVATDFSLERANEFPAMAPLLAFLAPRLADSLCCVRHWALRIIHCTFRLAYIQKGIAKDSLDATLFDPDIFIKEYLDCEGKLDFSASRQAVAVMADIIDARLPSSLIEDYLSDLFVSLDDRQNHVASASANLISRIIRCRGDHLKIQACVIAGSILSKLEEMRSSPQVYMDLHKALIELCNHQLHLCITAMLYHPLPHSIYVSEAWNALLGEHSIFPSIADHLIDLMMRVCDPDPAFDSNPVFDLVEVGDNAAVKIIQPSLCSLVASIIELVKGGGSDDDFIAIVPQILAALLVCLTNVIGTQYPSQNSEQRDGPKTKLIITPELRRISPTPASLISQAFIALFTRTQDEKIIEKMNSERAWTDLIDPSQYTTAISILLRALSENRAIWIGPLIDCLLSRSDSRNLGCRIAVVCSFCALVKMYPTSLCSENFDLVMNVLHKFVSDKSSLICKLAIRGFGDLSECDLERLSNYSSYAMDAIISGLDYTGDGHEEVTVEAIVSLTKLTMCIDIGYLHRALSDVLLKLRPCFEKENCVLRARSLSLVGELGARVGTYGVFKEQLLSNIVTILLYLNDQEEEVEKACVGCLLHLAPIFASDEISDLIGSQLKSYKSCKNYHVFLKAISECLVLSYPDRVNHFALSCNNYFKSTSSRIRSNAACLTGYLLLSLTPRLRSTISKELIFSGLSLLLKDQVVEVRLSAAKAISFLNSFD